MGDQAIEPLNLPASAAVRALLLDVEGTTTPIDFVFKTLFPFAAAHAESFLREHSEDPETREIIADLRQTWSGASAAGAPVWIETTPGEKLSSAAAYVRWLIARDSKMTPLKTLEGKIWEAGFHAGQLKGEVYPDVAPALARWRSQGRRLAIFSSGSVLAQKLLFTHSTAGDLSLCLDAYFDTTTGSKREAASYQKIASAVGLEAREILFVSDVGEELDAAARAQMRTALSVRPGAALPATPAHARISSFDQLFPNAPAG